MAEKLRAVIALDLAEELCQMIEAKEPRLEVVRDHSLYRPARSVADWGGDPNHQRTADEQRRYEEMVNSADVLFGLPDSNPQALARTVAANPKLRWVHTTAAGGGGQVKAAGLASADLERVTFTTSAGMHGDSLAEFALFGVLAGAKDLPRLKDQQQRKDWTGRWLMRQLDEMTVLIAGLGGIGKVCAKLFSALGAKVMGTTRSGEVVEGVDVLVPIEELGEAIKQADALVVTLPGTDKTNKLINEKIFSAAKPGLIVTNVGRGTVIDEDALLAGLESGQVSFAALDVTAVEPLPQDSPLWHHPRVLISPHTAALNRSEPKRIAELFADNATRLLDGRQQRNIVNTVEFY